MLSRVLVAPAMGDVRELRREKRVHDREDEDDGRDDVERLDRHTMAEFFDHASRAGVTVAFEWRREWRCQRAGRFSGDEAARSPEQHDAEHHEDADKVRRSSFHWK